MIQRTNSFLCFLFTFWMMGLFQSQTFGQNTDTTSQKKHPLLKISGALNASAIGYAVSGIAARRDPFYWLVSGNLTLSYWKIVAPFSFTLSQQDQTFRYPQPFNQFGISPTYKSITLHAGYRSLNFSEFTLAGTIFLGAAVEVMPPNSAIKGTVMYGRFAKARQVGGINDLELGIPSYERWGYGAKVTLGKNGQEIDLIAFRGRDDPNSLPDSLANQVKLTPAENFVTGIVIRRTVARRLSVNAEYALSAYTKDIRDPEAELQSYRYANHLGNLFTPTISSQSSGAFQGQLSYRADGFQINGKYRRLGPVYRTMGSPFMNNDFEDITGGVSTALFHNKFNVTTSAGIQRNNLNHSQETHVKRFIGSVSANMAISDSFGATVSYSNFNSSTKLDRFYEQSQLDRIDSLLYLQVTNSFNASLQYSLGKEIKSSFTLSGNYQVASDKEGNSSIFYNTNLGYQRANTQRDLTINANMNINSNKVAQTNNSIGPTIAINKMFMTKKLRTSLSSSYIQFYQSSQLLNENITARLSGSYATKSRHVLGADVSLLNRITHETGTPSFVEFRGGITYSYSFNKEL